MNREPGPTLCTRGCQAGQWGTASHLAAPSADHTPVCPSSLALTSDLQTTDAHRHLPLNTASPEFLILPQTCFSPADSLQKWLCSPPTCSGQSQGIILDLPWALTLNPPSKPV